MWHRFNNTDVDEAPIVLHFRALTGNVIYLLSSWPGSLYVQNHYVLMEM